MSDRALIILTSHDKLGETGKPTGFYWEELAAPYYALLKKGLEVDIASVKGGEAPADPGSAEGDAVTEPVKRFLADEAAMKAVKNTHAIDAIKAENYRVVYIPGGHGTMWDLAQSEVVGDVVAKAYDNGSVVGAVCHGPSGLLGATLSNGKSILDGKNVSGFTNSEEKTVGLEAVVPYALETRMRELGGNFTGGADFQPHAVRDGRLVTGQNPASSMSVGEKMIEALEEIAQAA